MPVVLQGNKLLDRRKNQTHCPDLSLFWDDVSQIAFLKSVTCCPNEILFKKSTTSDISQSEGSV